ncbi:MAG: hypothetical protein ABIL58_19915 [Pseudomonadota bacterium]
MQQQVPGLNIANYDQKKEKGLVKIIPNGKGNYIVSASAYNEMGEIQQGQLVPVTLAQVEAARQQLIDQHNATLAQVDAFLDDLQSADAAA